MADEFQAKLLESQHRKAEQKTELLKVIWTPPAMMSVTDEEGVGDGEGVSTLEGTFEFSDVLISMLFSISKIEFYSRIYFRNIQFSIFSIHFVCLAHF